MISPRRPGRPTGPRHLWRVAMVARRLLESAPPGPLLDAGAGAGTLALHLSAAGRSVSALDIAAAGLTSLAGARGLSGGRLQVVRGQIEALPWPDGHFAAAAAGEVIEHVDDRAAVAELWRVLVPGGALVVTVPAGPGRFGALDRAVGHWRRYDRARLRGVLQGAGFGVETLYGWGWPFGRIYDWVVQRPALAAGPRGRRVLGGLGGLAPVSVVWRALFAIDDTVAAGDRGSGLLAVARKPVAGAPEGPRGRGAETPPLALDGAGGP